MAGSPLALGGLRAPRRHIGFLSWDEKLYSNRLETISWRKKDEVENRSLKSPMRAGLLYAGGPLPVDNLTRRSNIEAKFEIALGKLDKAPLGGGDVVFPFLEQRVAGSDGRDVRLEIAIELKYLFGVVGHGGDDGRRERAELFS